MMKKIGGDKIQVKNTRVGWFGLYEDWKTEDERRYKPEQYYLELR
jgi:hypothetical protein